MPENLSHEIKNMYENSAIRQGWNKADLLYGELEQLYLLYMV